MQNPSNPPPNAIIIEERITKVNGDFHIKKYLRGQFLGKGGFAKVYKFTNLETNKVMAGKVMPKANLNKGRSRQKLMTEIRLHKSLTHLHIVKFEHVFEDQENVYILLELCEHQSMSELLRRRKTLTEFEVQSYIAQTVDALKYLHANRIIHRDLKLGNLFLSEKMQVKLGDFGLASKLEFDREKKRTICGTPNYLAPEIIDGKLGHSYEVDIWALGILMYAMLYGRPPFETAEVKETYKKIKAIEYSFPNSINVSENARDLIKRILVKQPEKRLTLDEILQHPFLTNENMIPKFLPISTMASPPTSSYIKQFTLTTTTMTGKVTNDFEVIDTMDILRSPKTSNILSGLVSPTTHTGFFNGMRSPSGDFHGDLFKMIPNTPVVDLLGSQKFNPLARLGREKSNSVSLERNQPLKSISFPKNENIILPFVKDQSPVIPNNHHQLCADSSPISENSDIIKEIRVVKWYDYSSKYGLAYVLSNGALGVCFNDGTKFISQNDEMFQYIVRVASTKQEIISSYSFDNYPPEVSKKVLVFGRFKEQFEDTLRQTPKQEVFAYVKKWIKTKHALLFRMNNQMLQVAFKDETMLILNFEAKKIVYIDAKGNDHYSNLENASSSQNKELAKRFKYTEEVLKHVWAAQGDGMVNKKNNEEEEKGENERNFMENPLKTVEVGAES